MKNFLNKIINTILSKDYLKILLVFSFFVIIFTAVCLSIDRFVSLDDHFFHIRFAEIIRSQGLEAFENFHWLYFSKISNNQSYFIYYNFLFYLALIPFTFVKPLFLGIKLYAVLFTSVYFTVLYYFFLKIKEKNAFFWVIILMAIINYHSVWRFLLTRPYAFAPAILIVELYLLYRKKYIGIFLVSFLYLYWHSVTFFFPLAVAGVYFMFDALYNKNKPDWKILISSAAGIISSLLVLGLFAPGFFSFMKNIYWGMFQDTIIGKKVNIAEGGELYPADFLSFIESNVLVIAMLLMAITFEIFRYIQERKGNIINGQEVERGNRPLKGALFLLSIGFLLGTFLSQRNGDFFVFFSAAYIVMSFNFFFNYIQITDILVRKALVTGIIITVIYLLSANFIFLRNQIASTGPYDAIEGAADWLKNNTQKGEVVFNASWNWFPTLFYYDTHNYYIAGIEPRFLYDYDPKLYWVWTNISNEGTVCWDEECANVKTQKVYYMKNEDRKKEWYRSQGDQIASVIKDTFKSRYVVTSKDLVYFNDVMNNNDHFQKVFTDNIYNQFFVYKIN